MNNNNDEPEKRKIGVAWLCVMRYEQIMKRKYENIRIRKSTNGNLIKIVKRVFSVHVIC